MPTTSVQDRLVITDQIANAQVQALRKNCADFGVEFFDVQDAEQGIVHMIGPELGATKPGMTIVCGDSHTSTHGAFGALAFGIGTSEVEHVMATQTLPQAKPKTFRINVEGELPTGVTAKDIILDIIGRIGTDGATGYVVEYAGSAIRALSMEGRMTVCNMSIEAGARAGMIAPDEKTFAYLKGRRFVPKGEAWDLAVEQWSSLVTDTGAVFDRELTIDATKLAPSVTWGTSPGMVTTITSTVPTLADARTDADRKSFERAYEYMDAEARDADRRDHRRCGLPRLLHQRPHRRPARRREDRRRLPRRDDRARDGRARLAAGEEAGRGRRARRGLQVRRL